MLEVTDKSFDEKVLLAPRPVVVDFWAPWCGPCHAVSPILEQLAAAHAGRVAFAKVNVDENPRTASRYDVFSLPTAILFQDGEPCETVVGARPRSYFESAFAPWLAPAD